MNVKPIEERLRERGLQPHQVKFVGDLLDSAEGGRVLVSDERFTGSRRSVLWLAASMAESLDRVPRILMITADFAVDWWKASFDEAWESFHEDEGDRSRPSIVGPNAFRSAEAETSGSQNPWSLLPIKGAVSARDREKLTSMSFRLLDRNKNVRAKREAY